MYAETGVLFPHFHSFSHHQHIDDSSKIQRPNALLTALVQSSTICDYDMGGEGGLFEAPKPIIQEEGLKLADLESLQNDPLLSDDVFYECKKDLLEKAAMEMETLLSEAQIPENNPIFDAPFQKSISSGSLTSSFQDFHGVEASSACGMRRAFSEGDVKGLCYDQVGSLFTIEERKEKLLRYRNKRSKRNFCRKIKYACRKALADSQPRIRGRFAKTEECDAKRV